LSFEDDLLRAIEDGKSAAADFNQSWQVCRESVIMPIFERAADVFVAAFKDKGGGGKAELKNGTAVTLYAARTRDAEPEYSLTFEADKMKREIVCSYVPPIAPIERFDLDRFSREEIESKVKHLARAVAESRQGQR
jgi:hypothetical protein